MKKVMNKINFAIIGLMASMPAFAANATNAAANSKQITIDNGMCDLLKSLQHVFNILRIMAFIGAAFYIAGWAWTYISKAGDDKAGFSVEDVKKKGVGLLVGFSLLFFIGLILSFVMSASGLQILGCGDILKKW